MIATFWPTALTAVLLVHGIARAAQVEVDVADLHGHALADAVVELEPAQQAAAANRLSIESIVDQRRETFLPLVTLIRKGGRVIFTNNDTTMHQVYSFSPIRQFAFEIDEGERSPPVVFEKPGVAAIGCNIHDHMITYVYVADSPWAAISGPSGRATIDGAPQGNYRATVWHPQLAPGAPQIFFSVAVTAGVTKTAVAVPVASTNPHRREPMHMQMY
jgi:plastocyanin